MAFTVLWPGAQKVLSVNATLTHGITPSIANLTIIPQIEPPKIEGSLVFNDGKVAIRWDGARIVDSSLRRDAGGEIWNFQVADRRWKWAFGSISGRYNTRKENDRETSEIEMDTVISRRQSYRELMTICLEAMGENRFDVADVPDFGFPPVSWEYANPASALAELCDQIGFRVVPQLNGRIAIKQLGAGRDLPPDYTQILQEEQSVNPPELPDAITLVGSPIEFQIDLPLEPVGLEYNFNENDPIQTKHIVRVDRLSYLQPPEGIIELPPKLVDEIAPFEAIAYHDLYGRVNPPGEETEEEIEFNKEREKQIREQAGDTAAQLREQEAYDTVLKWYRIRPNKGMEKIFEKYKEVGAAPFEFAEEEEKKKKPKRGRKKRRDKKKKREELSPLTHIQQLLPLQNRQHDQLTNFLGETVLKSAEVIGKFYDEEDFNDEEGKFKAKHGKVLDETEEVIRVCERPFVLDQEWGVVKFSEKVYRRKSFAIGMEELKTGYFLQPAELFLRCVLTLRHAETGQVSRYAVTKTLNEKNEKPAKQKKQGRQKKQGKQKKQKKRKKGLPKRSLIVPVPDALLRVRADYSGGEDRDFRNDMFFAKNVPYDIDDWSKSDEIEERITRRYRQTLSQLRVEAGRTFAYIGLKGINLDGKIRQVAWSLDASGATTRASQDTELAETSYTYDERRLYEREGLRASAMVPSPPPPRGDLRASDFRGVKGGGFA